MRDAGSPARGVPAEPGVDEVVAEGGAVVEHGSPRSAAPYLLFALPLPHPIAVVTVAVASAGFSAGLLLQDRLVALTPDDMRGQALGLHSAGMLTMQAVGASVAGSVAQYVSPATAMALMASASLAVTVTLTPRLRESADARP